MCTEQISQSNNYQNPSLPFPPLHHVHESLLQVNGSLRLYLGATLVISEPHLGLVRPVQISALGETYNTVNHTSFACSLDVPWIVQGFAAHWRDPLQAAIISSYSVHRVTMGLLH